MKYSSTTVLLKTTSKNMAERCAVLCKQLTIKTSTSSNKNKQTKHETPITLCEIQDTSSVRTQLSAELEKLTQALCYNLQTIANHQMQPIRLDVINIGQKNATTVTHLSQMNIGRKYPVWISNPEETEQKQTAKSSQLTRYNARGVADDQKTQHNLKRCPDWAYMETYI